jgi:hypothetical protein
MAIIIAMEEEEAVVWQLVAKIHDGTIMMELFLIWTVSIGQK